MGYWYVWLLIADCWLWVVRAHFYRIFLYANLSILQIPI